MTDLKYYFSRSPDGSYFIFKTKGEILIDGLSMAKAKAVTATLNYKGDSMAEQWLRFNKYYFDQDMECED